MDESTCYRRNRCRRSQGYGAVNIRYPQFGAAVRSLIGNHVGGRILLEQLRLELVTWIETTYRRRVPARLAPIEFKARDRDAHAA